MAIACLRLEIEILLTSLLMMIFFFGKYWFSFFGKKLGYFIPTKTTVH